MKKCYMTIRKLTIAPIMAILMLTAIMLFAPHVLQSASIFALSLFFLGVLPTLAYPMQKYIPSYKDKGRDGQRRLAMIFAVAGYILGIAAGLIVHAPKETMVIYLVYLLSGILIFIFNKCFHIKISGHACGIFAPICLFFYFGLYFCAAAGCVISILVYVASLKTGRHTLPQLIGGSIVPIAVLLPIYFLM